MAAQASPATEVAGERSIATSFFTRHSFPAQQMPVTTFALPSTTLIDGLNALVNDVVFSDAPEEKPPAPIPFDFIINDEYLPASTSLETFLRRQRRRLGLPADVQEEVLQVEYLPAFQAQEGAKLPHDDWISAVRAPIPGNPEFLITGAYDHAVRVWAGESCLAVGTGHAEAVKAVAFVPGTVSLHDNGATPGRKAVGKRRGRDAGAQQQASFDMISAGKDGTLRAWRYDAAATKLEPLVTTASALGATLHADSIDTVDVSADGQLVATGSWDTSCCVLRYSELIAGASVKPLYTLSDHARAVLSVRFSPQHSNTLYTTGLDGSVKLWDVEAGMLKGTLKGSDHGAQGMSVRPPGPSSASSNDLILTGHTDNRVRLHDPRVGGGAGAPSTVVKTFAGHRQWIYSVAWLWRAEEDAAGSDAPVTSSATTLLASASEDSTLRIWDLRSTASALLTLDSLHTDGILDVTYAGSMSIASGGKDNRTKSVKVEQP